MWVEFSFPWEGMIDWLDEEVWPELNSQGRWDAAPCLLFDYSIYVGYLPFSATKVSARRRKEMKGKRVIACSKESLRFNMIKKHDF